ncbi:MAG TPA: F0F1 ATP synthase subunit A [Gammaproteobacteria bacterium]
MNGEGLQVAVLFQLGPLAISVSLASSIAITALLGLGAWWFSRRLALLPNNVQVALEAVVEVMEEAVAQVAGSHTRQIMPFIASLWVFLIVANLLGLIPGLESPTRDLSVTSALAIMVFFSVHWFGIRSQGLRRYLRHYLESGLFMLPFEILSEITRTVALAVRLFGNMMSLEMAALMFLLLAGFLVPIPILMLHVVEALVQAYIFGMLALIYVAGGIQSREEKQVEQGEINE